MKQKIKFLEIKAEKSDMIPPKWTLEKVKTLEVF